MTAAAEQYAYSAVWVSGSLLVAAIAVFLWLRNDLRFSCLAGAALIVHPAWTVTDTWYDNGESLRLASTIWILIGCIALFAALFAVYRHGIRLRRRLSLRFTSRSLLMLTVVVAMVIVLIRPPLSDAIPVSRSVPALGLFLMLIIALHRPEVMKHSKRPARIEIPKRRDIDRNEVCGQWKHGGAEHE